VVYHIDHDDGKAQPEVPPFLDHHALERMKP